MFIRIVSVEESQVGELNLWNAQGLNERFISKYRGVHWQPATGQRRTTDYTASALFEFPSNKGTL